MNKKVIIFFRRKKSVFQSQQRNKRNNIDENMNTPFDRQDMLPPVFALPWL